MKKVIIEIEDTNKVIIEIQNGLIDGDAQLVKEKTELALAQGIKPKKIIQQGLLLTMRSMSKKFCKGEIFIPDVLMSSRAMHASLYVLQPILSLCNQTSKGVVVIGTVAGDLHDIGKNMVSMMLRGAGYSVIDLGIDVPITDFVAAIREHKPDVLAMSALLTTTMGELGKVVMALKEEGLRRQVKIIVGGAPVTQEFAVAVEADAYAVDSFTAIEVVDALVGEKVELFTVS